MISHKLKDIMVMVGGDCNNNTRLVWGNGKCYSGDRKEEMTYLYSSSFYTSNIHFIIVCLLCVSVAPSISYVRSYFSTSAVQNAKPWNNLDYFKLTRTAMTSFWEHVAAAVSLMAT